MIPLSNCCCCGSAVLWFVCSGWAGVLVVVGTIAFVSAVFGPTCPNIKNNTENNEISTCWCAVKFNN